MEKNKVGPETEKDNDKFQDVDPVVRQLCDLVRRHLIVADLIKRLAAQFYDLKPSVNSKESTPLHDFGAVVTTFVVFLKAYGEFSEDFFNFLKIGFKVLVQDPAKLTVFEALIAGGRAKPAPRTDKNREDVL